MEQLNCLQCYEIVNTPQLSVEPKNEESRPQLLRNKCPMLHPKDLSPYRSRVCLLQ
jgi:hypothetical protein